MLRGIPPVISPALMHTLMSMGHGDEIVFADGNFPAASNARRLARADGVGVTELLEAVAPFFPLDQYDDEHALVMEVVEEYAPEPPIWDEFRAALSRSEGRPVSLTPVERFAFYERARRCFAVVATSESAVYANLILKKGVVYNGAEIIEKDR
ncbi:MAG: fucose isomerase [Candidatus Poribacteria bacterium]|nr:fucose isomerase [Candidatus Poribacteria bacterium]